MKLPAKTVLITGTTSGIGRAAVNVFAEAGWNVAAASRKPSKVESKHPGQVKAYVLDVTEQVSVTECFASVIKDFGSIDVVVNNAGYAVDGVFEAIDDESVRRQFDVNVFGLMRMTRAAVSHMRVNGGGTIIQISSMGGRVTFPLYSVYHATKWAVEGFSESLQYELRQFNIRLKIIEPGVIKTPFYAANRQYVEPAADLGYDQFVAAVESVSQSSAATGEDPAEVARVIFKAAESDNNKLRYAVGRPAPALIMLRKTLPDRIFLAMIRRIFRIRA